MESRGGLCTHIAAVRGWGCAAISQPIPSHHGWWALPVSILVGTCWHSQLKVRVIPGGIVVPPCVGVLALILAIQITAWVFFPGAFPSPGNCWHQLGSGGVWEQSQSSPLEGRGFILPTCLKLGGMSVQETPKSCRWRNALAKESKREKKGF